MDQAWHELLAADWPQLRAICERDVVHRVGVIGEHGWATTIESLHPGIAWRAGGIEVGFFRGGTVRLAGDGLLLIPSVFVGNVAAHLEDPWPRTLVYRARGTAALWGEQETVPQPDALTVLVGRARARLLLALDAPASTSHLARSLAMAPGAVGDHLAILGVRGCWSAPGPDGRCSTGVLRSARHWSAVRAEGSDQHCFLRRRQQMIAQPRGRKAWCRRGFPSGYAVGGTSAEVRRPLRRPSGSCPGRFRARCRAGR